jgi:hypothetical protein
MGKFIIDLPSDKSLNSTSFWTARVALPGGNETEASSSSGVATGKSFWDNPEGNPTPPSGNHTTPWRRNSVPRADNLNLSPDGLYRYSKPIQYLVRKTGYYCVGKRFSSLSPGLFLKIV